ncbi:helix-turn-helix domain-containing protein [Leifsonia sp. NPDC058292]|uniref:helix-turn-helix domain-containing protein n=1 Tax=Leifsonia sp. NPDC058292 TaxID=3346428 RepID=UPI0036DD6D5B
MNASGAVIATEGRDAATAGLERPQSKGVLTVRPDEAVTVERHWPSEEAAAFVRHYWIPRWTLAPGVSVRQDILEYPTANLAIEPDAAALYRARRGRSARVLSGSGWALGVLLRPGAARGLVGGSLRAAPAVIRLDSLALPDVAGLTERVRTRMLAGDDRGAIEAFETWLVTSVAAPDDDAALVDAIVYEVENDHDITRVEQLASRFDLGVRHLQRLVAGHIGFGPKWLIQRYRLQEAAAALRSGDAPPLAEVAARLGYADQAHFGREFKAVIGATPGAYLAAALAAGADGAGAEPGETTSR